MRWTRLTAFVGVLPLCGCTLISRAVYNVEYDKALRADLQGRSTEHRRLAEQALAEGGAGGDPDFDTGFVDGFADHLDRGGPGGPPAVPPNHYRFGPALSGPGRAAAGRYADGFTAGAAAARAGGLRADTLVPVFLPPVAAADPVTPVAGEKPAPGPRPEVLPPPGQLGPTPREVGRGRWGPRPTSPTSPTPVRRRPADDPGVLAPAGP